MKLGLDLRVADLPQFTIEWLQQAVCGPLPRVLWLTAIDPLLPFAGARQAAAAQRLLSYALQNSAPASDRSTFDFGERRSRLLHVALSHPEWPAHAGALLGALWNVEDWKAYYLQEASVAADAPPA